MGIYRINHPFWGTSILGNPLICILLLRCCHLSIFARSWKIWKRSIIWLIQWYPSWGVDEHWANKSTTLQISWSFDRRKDRRCDLLTWRWNMIPMSLDDFTYGLSCFFMATLLSYMWCDPHKTKTGWWARATPSWKIWIFVNWDDDRNPIFMGKWEKWQPNHQPTRRKMPV